MYLLIYKHLGHSISAVNGFPHNVNLCLQPRHRPIDLLAFLLFGEFCTDMAPLGIDVD
jgi:hypothetical protein